MIQFKVQLKKNPEYSFKKIFIQWSAEYKFKKIFIQWSAEYSIELFIHKKCGKLFKIPK